MARKWTRCIGYTSPRWLGPQLPRFLFYSALQVIQLYTTKEEQRRYFTVYTKERGNTVPKGLNVSPAKQYYIYKHAWQPSLMLGDLGRARVVPIACEGSSLGLALQPTKAQIIWFID